MVRLDNVDNGLQQRGRREEFPFVDGLLDGEFLEEVFVNAAKEIAARGRQVCALSVCKRAASSNFPENEKARFVISMTAGFVTVSRVADGP